MCGIAGIFNFDKSKINPEISNIIKNSLEHRGPDFSKIDYIDENVSLIHTRLAIIDLDSRSNQPMHSFDKRFSIVFNGDNVFDNHYQTSPGKSTPRRSFKIQLVSQFGAY